MGAVKITPADKKARQAAASRRWEAKNPEKVKQYKRESGKRYREKHAEKISKWHSKQWQRLKGEAFAAVGSEVCVNCGFSDPRALQIDHVNGGGRQHMASFSSNKTYLRYVIDNPQEFQILCANCNWIKRHENGEFRARD